MVNFIQRTINPLIMLQKAKLCYYFSNGASHRSKSCICLLATRCLGDYQWKGAEGHMWCNYGGCSESNFTAEMRSVLSETEILADCKNKKTELETTAPQLAESQVEVYFPSKAILANMSHFSDTWGSKWSNLVFLAACQGSWRLLDCALTTVYSIKNNCTLILSPEGEKVAKQHLHVSLCGKHKYSDRNKNSALGFPLHLPSPVDVSTGMNVFATRRSSQ